MTLRDKRQDSLAQVFISTKKKNGILNVAPRVGKTSIGIRVLQSMDKDCRVLISYPQKTIETAWVEEFKRMNYKNKKVTFTTHHSLKKFILGKYDILIIDDIHTLSEFQIKIAKNMKECASRILGLTGTLSDDTESILRKSLEIDVLAKYSIEDAINEGIISDYEITVLTVPLDTKHKVKYKSSTRTEKEQFDAYGAVIEKLEKTGADTFYLRLARMRLIQASRAKLEATGSLLKKLTNERVLTFCGLTKTADALSCPSYHSKSKNSKDFDNFTTGKGNHIAVVKIGDTGVTYKPLSKVVINYFDSNPENLCQKINRCMGLEYSNPGKKADIWIVSSDEQVELNWLRRALKFFDPKKITYI